jgi:cytochrome bd-type quinol oxidase subunit 2
MTPERPPPPPISTSLRPALALMAGLGITVLIVFTGVTISTLAALRGQDERHYVAPFWTYPVHLLITAVGAAAGGFATARITSGRSAYSVFLLALILLMSALGPVMRHVPPAPGQPGWYAMALAIVSPLAALGIGLLVRRVDARRRDSEAS